LAALAKENGVLLPLLVLVTEATVLRHRPRTTTRSLWRLWQLIFLIAPTALLAGYLTLRMQYSESVLVSREFSAPDRLLSQAYILWEYLYRAFLPTTASL